MKKDTGKFVVLEHPRARKCQECWGLFRSLFERLHSVTSPSAQIEAWWPEFEKLSALKLLQKRKGWSEQILVEFSTCISTIRVAAKGWTRWLSLQGSWKNIMMHPRNMRNTPKGGAQRYLRHRNTVLLGTGQRQRIVRIRFVVSRKVVPANPFLLVLLVANECP